MKIIKKLQLFSAIMVIAVPCLQAMERYEYEIQIVGNVAIKANDLKSRYLNQEEIKNNLHGIGILCQEDDSFVRVSLKRVNNEQDKKYEHDYFPLRFLEEFIEKWRYENDISKFKIIVTEDNKKSFLDKLEEIKKSTIKKIEGVFDGDGLSLTGRHEHSYKYKISLDGSRDCDYYRNYYITKTPKEQSAPDMIIYEIFKNTEPGDLLIPVITESDIILPDFLPSKFLEELLINPIVEFPNGIIIAFQISYNREKLNNKIGNSLESIVESHDIDSNQNQHPDNVVNNESDEDSDVQRAIEESLRHLSKSSWKPYLIGGACISIAAAIVAWWYFSNK